MPKKKTPPEITNPKDNPEKIPYEEPDETIVPEIDPEIIPSDDPYEETPFEIPEPGEGP